jgi:FAD/FMN-containing dehydrogenase
VVLLVVLHCFFLLPFYLCSILNPIDPSTWIEGGLESIPADFPIRVDEENATVTVAAGITQRMLFEYLGNYTHWKEPRGWAIPAYSWFIDQTVAGAVSTGTHGSTLRWGSLSSQVRGLKAVLANGTMLELNSPADNPYLWKALGVSVGRLGVITEVTLRIVPAEDVTRTSQKLTFDGYVDQLMEFQQVYQAALKTNDSEAITAALAVLDESSAFWVAPTNTVYRLDFTHAEKTPTSSIENIDLKTVEAMEGPPADAPLPALPGVFDQIPSPAVEPNPNQIDPNLVMLIGEASASGVEAYVYNATLPRSRAFPTELENDVRYFARSAPYDQLEVSVSLEQAASCMKTIGDEMYGPAELWKGFRTPVLIRFVNGEPFFLSTTYDGPRIYINMEDYVTPNGAPNPWFDRVVEIFMTKCDGRLHWGKWGWVKYQPCFDGAVTFEKTWCDFGCAVNQLDPTGKFSSESNVWRWNATDVNGKEVADFGSCCTPQGFNKAMCTCAPSASSSPSCGVAEAKGGSDEVATTSG